MRTKNLIPENMIEADISRRFFIEECAAFGLGLCLLGISSSNSFSSPGNGLWKWSKEAFNYKKSGKYQVDCLLCPNGCTLSEGDRGVCKVRTNKNGKLYSLVYGNPCAVHIDPIEKKPLSHFLPTTKAFSIATAGCNLSCLNCQNWTISQFPPEETQNIDLMPDKVVEACIDNGCPSIAYTYAEPTIFYEYMYDTARLAKKKGLRNVIKSNGYIKEGPLKELCKYMDAANIDLKSFDEKIYNNLNAGSLQPVLNTLKVYKEMKVWLEITNIIIPTWSDNMDMVRRMCKWLVSNGFSETPLHFTRFNPLYKLTHLPQTPVSTLESAHKIALAEGMKYAYIGNVPGHNFENTFCPNCKKMIIERKGFYILQNNLNNGKCKYCGTKIQGVWK